MTISMAISNPIASPHSKIIEFSHDNFKYIMQNLGYYAVEAYSGELGYNETLELSKRAKVAFELGEGVIGITKYKMKEIAYLADAAVDSGFGLYWREDNLH